MLLGHEALDGTIRRLVRTDWAHARINLLVDALLRHGTLSSEEIAALAHRSFVSVDPIIGGAYVPDSA